MEDNIINKVAGSELISLNLEDYYLPGERVVFDIKDWLYEGLLLREKDFRASIKEQDWSQYKDKYVAITCSTDAIVPTWAYMLIALHLEPFSKKSVFGDLILLETVLFDAIINTINPLDFKDQRVVIKGCGDLPIPVSAYVEIARKLRPYVKSIMYGEPCSTVPLYKNKQ